VAAAEMAGSREERLRVRARGDARGGRRTPEGAHHEDARNVVGDVREKS
jgi:hypothetical protein